MQWNGIKLDIKFRMQLGWDINNLFQEKQMNLWNREGFKGEGMERVNTAVHLLWSLTEPRDLPRNQNSGASPTGTQAEGHKYL